MELAEDTPKGVRRRAIADVALVGSAQVGDEVIVNVEALDLALGSGGFDIVHVNLTRGLDAAGEPGANVMKLNYTSLQHAVAPVEDARLAAAPRAPRGRAGAARAACRGGVGLRAGRSRRAPRLCANKRRSAAGRALAHGAHAARAGIARRASHSRRSIWRGGRGDHDGGRTAPRLRGLDWDAAVCGPGPGIVGSSSVLGHGGMAALDSAHVSLALGCRTLLVARMSTSDDRERHRGISHHTLTVLDLLLDPVTVALPAGMRSPVGADLRAGLGAVFGGAMPAAPRLRSTSSGPCASPVTTGDARGGPARLCSEWTAEGDDGPRAGRGPAFLRGGARRRHRAG